MPSSEYRRLPFARGLLGGACLQGGGGQEGGLRLFLCVFFLQFFCVLVLYFPEKHKKKRNFMHIWGKGENKWLKKT